MAKRHKLIIVFAVAIVAVLVSLLAHSEPNFAILNTKGAIAEQERSLLIYASLLSLIVVIPVFFMAFFIAWKYREGNHKAKYRPDWDHNTAIEAVWWLVPLALISVLSVITWKSSHALDPFRPLDSAKKSVTIQVVALQWKWLFIYPEQNLATVNYLQFPEDTPINFHVTADAPMNSFWIPQLGGQIYAMTGMSTNLHLMADEPGTYRGVSANISGAGFADMNFKAQASTEADYRAWLKETRRAPSKLSSTAYAELSKPSTEIKASSYSSVDENLYATILSKYMAPAQSADSKQPAHGHEESHQ